MSYSSYGWRGWAPYVSVAERRRKAAGAVEKLKKKGETILPVTVEGRTIARTFWGRSWCDNLEHYSDYANRLPRGKTYLRNGSVVHLNIEKGKISALVSGSKLYKVGIEIKALPKAIWEKIKAESAGKIGSLVELLQGRFSDHVMATVTRQRDGLFPAPVEIEMACSCPDSAIMCKHVAAALYGVGTRLDENPELLFKLRDVDHLELVSQATAAQTLRTKVAQPAKIKESELSDLFGIDLDGDKADERPASLKAKTRINENMPVRAIRSKAAPAKQLAKATTKKKRPTLKPKTAIAVKKSKKKTTVGKKPLNKAKTSTS